MAIQSKTTHSSQTQLDIARETFKKMAANRVVPTPDNYERIYNELAGVETKQPLESVLMTALGKLPQETKPQIKLVNDWKNVIKQENWRELPTLLNQAESSNTSVTGNWPAAINALLKAWGINHIGLDTKKKQALLDRVLSKYRNDPELPSKIAKMVDNWSDYDKIDGAKGIAVNDDTLAEVENAVVAQPQEKEIKGNGVFDKTPDPFQENFKVLHEMLCQTLRYGLIPRLDGYPELQEAASEIFKLADNAKQLTEWEQLVKQFRRLMVKVELIASEEAGVKNDLLRVLKLLVDNIGDLVIDDQWLRGQVAVVQTIISSPIDRETLSNAENKLKEVIYKQGLLKHSLQDTQETFKTMLATFVERLGHMADSTGTFETSVNTFQDKISETDDVTVINALLEDLMHDTHVMQADIIRSRDELNSQKNEVAAAHVKVKELEEELTSLSEQVRVDQLTGVLNRRGLDEAIVREIERSNRTGDPLSVALLDIDNFKNLNDTYGHDVGDDALKHLATVVSETVRPTDIVTRFGGEEFVILLPATGLEDALNLMKRLQRDLTRKFFLANKEQLLLTFSAGVALYRKDEDEGTVLHRADQAMYLAKKTGKNKAMTEKDLVG